ncbi:MAG: hypothetical protein WC002_05345 [Candidatus Muiribacteriota bacterium]|jgi:hypothetical protein
MDFIRNENTEVFVDSLVEANKNFKEMVDTLCQRPEEIITCDEKWKLLLRLRDRLKDSNTSNSHIAKFNEFCVNNIHNLADLPSFKHRPYFYWWNHLDLVRKGDMEVHISKADVRYNGVGYSIE